MNNLWVKAASATERDAPLLTSNVNKSPRSWSPDGTSLAYEAVGARGDIWILPLAGARTPFPFQATAFDERDPRFSPDGRWLAYRSDESGRNEVYVRPFPKGEGRWVDLDRAAALAPKWRGDGRELFYEVNRRSGLPPLSTPSATGLDVGKPQRLFDIGTGSAGWDVTRDGQRLLVGRGVESERPGR